tara:strand:+ start:2447 stop:3433 length:987 start_codon:yes stop_codon:yes gene_type:complete
MTATDVQAVEKIREARDRICCEVGKVIFGQQKTVEQLLISLVAGGHCLIVGVPGLAKTTLVNTLANALDLSFGRIQFTPDLMPSDIVGTEILEEDMDTGRKGFRFIKGPIFTNVLLADEINRTPPKTQAALLQSMQEGVVTVGSKTLNVGNPFFVLATQNPIEQEGTYPLPEAQLDRFLFQINMDYPDIEEEEDIARSTAISQTQNVKPVLDAKQLIDAQLLALRMPIADHLIKMAVQLVRSSRPKDVGAPDYIRELVNWGAGPRASRYIVMAAKARAILDGRFSVAEEDVREVSAEVLCHRIVVNYHAEAQNISPRDLVSRLLKAIT